MSDLLDYADGKWTNEKGNQIFFEEDYLLKTTRNRTVAFAQKEKKQELNSVWKSRLNKNILCVIQLTMILSQTKCYAVLNLTEQKIQCH